MFVKITNLPLYPLFFVAYPLLALLGFNIDETALNVVGRSLFFVLAGALILMTLLVLLLRNWHRAAFITSILVLLFFTYGHVYSYLKAVDVFGFVLGRHRQLLSLGAIVAALSSWWAVRKLKEPQRLAPTLNLFSIFLLIYPLFQTVSYVTREAQSRRALFNGLEESVYSDLPVGYAPDIYYIILDAYGRADTLQAVVDYDNSVFLNSLRAKGVYVADCAQSNDYLFYQSGLQKNATL